MQCGETVTREANKTFSVASTCESSTKNSSWGKKPPKKEEKMSKTDTLIQ